MSFCGWPLLTAVTRVGSSMESQGCARTTSGCQHTGGDLDRSPGVQFGPSHLGWVRHGAARGRVWPVRRSPGAAGPELTTGALQPAAVGLGTEHVPRLPCPSWKPPPTQSFRRSSGFLLLTSTEPSPQRVPTQGSEARAGAARTGAHLSWSGSELPGLTQGP